MCIMRSVGCAKRRRDHHRPRDLEEVNLGTQVICVNFEGLTIIGHAMRGVSRSEIRPETPVTVLSRCSSPVGFGDWGSGFKV